jgi:hypothetical protein
MSDADKTIPFKQSDTFILACTYREDGTPVDLTTFEIASQVRDSSGTLVADLTVTLADQGTDPGVFTLSCADTSPWPIDLLPCDIQFTLDGNVRSTQTFFVAVEPEVTRG